VLEKEVEKAEATEVFYQIEMPLVPVLASMEWEGFPVDPQVLIQLGTEIEDKLEGMTETIHSLAGMEFNINSPQQLSQVLFEKLGLPHGKKTTRGYSTGADVLEALMEKHPIIPFVLEYRTFSKIKSTYVDGLLPLIHEDGKIHAHFQQTVAATGRISCTEPNLQNIPIRQELGRRIRKAFVAGNGYLLMGADYRQIELRILAHLAGDETMLEGFRRGEDIHRITAAKVLGVPEDDITPEQRSRAKAVNFGVIYGMSGFGLSEELGISRMEAERYIQQYFDKYHTVKDFLDRLVREGKEQGYSTTIFNRKRPLPEITASNYMVRQMGERLAMNSPIQGSAADIIKKAMIEVYQRLRQEGLGSKLILQVHDELILRVVQGEEERVKGLLCECMESAVVLKVPLAVDFHQGDDWYELK
jgi:DNA polymerase-1